MRCWPGAWLRVSLAVWSEPYSSCEPRNVVDILWMTGRGQIYRARVPLRRDDDVFCQRCSYLMFYLVRGIANKKTKWAVEGCSLKYLDRDIGVQS
jgi:hypothetical protein